MELAKIAKLIYSQQNEIKSNPKLLESYIKIEKTYIPIQIKRQMVKNIVNFSLYTDEETKLLKHDIILQDLMTVLHIITECTDIQIENLLNEGELNIDVAVKAYDRVLQLGIYKYIEERLENNDIIQLVNYEIQQQLSVVNSVSHVVLKSLEKLFSIIPSQDKIQELISTLPQSISQLNGLQILGDNLSQVTTENPSGVVNIQETETENNIKVKKTKKK